MATKKRLLTGLQPSGSLHIGNYFGALRPFIDIYEEYDSHLMIADYHALTTVHEPDEMHQQIVDIVKAYIVAGVDPERAIIFKQSDVPEHTELAWIFECLVTVPFLMQAHAYKDKVAKGIEASAGLFNYPMLMAADILLYDTEVVPVGEDQRQHIEYTREAATKFNNRFGETFSTPEERIIEGVGVVPGTDGQKMSKSYKNTIPLFGTKDEIAKAVMGIVTDSEGAYPENVYAIHTLFKEKEALDMLYNEHKGNYKALKEALITDIESRLAPMREKFESITEQQVSDVLSSGATRARERALEKMKDVKVKIGVNR